MDIKNVAKLEAFLHTQLLFTACVIESWLGVFKESQVDIKIKVNSQLQTTSNSCVLKE